MALYKKEVLIKPTSVSTHDEAVATTRAFVNSFQNMPTNKDGSGAYIDFFFADLFDSRNGNLYRVFSDACTTQYAMPNIGGLIKYTILDNTLLALKTEVPSVAGLATISYVDTAVASGVGSADLTAINAAISNHETRIGTLESASTTDGESATYVIE